VINLSKQLKTTLNFQQVQDLKAVPGQAGKGHTVRRLVGGKVTPTEQVEYLWHEYEQGVREPLHWHIHEMAYYIVSGKAVLRDIRGKTHDLAPVTLVYAPAGISGAHSFEAKTKLEMLELDVYAEIDGPSMPWILVDEKTKMSTIEFESILKFGKASPART
jgi:hypothetical protein